ncbi:P-loop containing nucleoside triphosphate hydrolases superfamily protein [Actinidia rufa]|uniref:Kinesin-like protein n=1 Tax=Actinidia rufa TaxID=165716 RepID=A0A7J0FWA5_9ERIC|nr:P-loop containing nucleoside triphosphate hydrolases superfamily protein [Actinidia rufa]
MFLDSTSDQTLETVTYVTEQIGGYIASMAERDVLDGNQEMRDSEEQIEELGNEVQDTISEQIGENTASMDQSDVSDKNQEMCSDAEQTLPILQKVEELGNKSLKKKHVVLCNEVKGITADSFPGSEVFSALQNLSTEHENFKNKYHEESELLKKKYLEECSERKRLYNEVIELKGNIRVFCRCRPLNQDEIANGSSSIVDFDSSQENELQITCSDSSKKQFKFDHVFRPEDNQEAVFVQTSPIVTSVLDGYNVCIFAYGQTGTGKTFTMEGTHENRGVNYRTLEELFRISNERSSVMRYELFVSMLEVYNEKIRDLLIENSNQPAKKYWPFTWKNRRTFVVDLPLLSSFSQTGAADQISFSFEICWWWLEIKQGAEGTQEVPGLVEARVYGTNEVWELLKSGSRARAVGSTNANELSSRSHCLLRVTVKGESLINGQRTRSHLWLVDLAGSERVGRIEVEGERNSKLTHMLQSSLGEVLWCFKYCLPLKWILSALGGDCKTLMVVQISPNTTDLGETLCSLNFASRVRGIEHGPARKQGDHTDLFKYKQMAEKAKLDEKEMKKLQDSLQSLQLRLAAREHICRSLQEKSHQAQKAIAGKKPPLAPSNMRLPLRRITNFLPPPSPLPPHKTKTSASSFRVSTEDKENMSKTKPVLKARRGSIAVRPSPSTNQVLKPKRRASIATFRPEPNSNGTTPLNNSNARLRTDRFLGRQSFVWDPQRVWRTSRVETTVEATPTAGSRSSKFMGSPPTAQAGSWKPKLPTVVARYNGSL